MKKRIVHIIISCFYKEGYGYQENILPLKHKELGYDTSIITYRGAEHILPQSIMMNKNEQVQEYTNSDGIKVYVLPNNNSCISNLHLLRSVVPLTKGLYHLLHSLDPDIIFAHGFMSSDHLTLSKYKKAYPLVRIFADHHGDYYNSPLIKGIKGFLVRNIYQKYLARKIENSVEMLWGVTPWRVQYLREVYGISSVKSQLLVMGGDENYIDWEHKDIIRRDIRHRYGISNDSFLIITGGKIDRSKNIHFLIEAVKVLKKRNVTLLVFGNMDNEMDILCKDYWDASIVNLGWLDNKNMYSYYLASDLGCFPGTHSVLWEQACASGLPCIFKNWDDGMKHVDIGGNCLFLENVSTESIITSISYLIDNQDVYNRMKEVSYTKARKIFSYLEIAKHSILS